MKENEICAYTMYNIYTFFTKNTRNWFKLNKREQNVFKILFNFTERVGVCYYFSLYTKPYFFYKLILNQCSIAKLIGTSKFWDQPYKNLNRKVFLSS